jgi:sec-independent protein translocase protein TatA
MENLGSGELLLIFLVILIFFGPKKIPELAGSLGKGLRKFREAKDGLEGQIKTAMKEPMEALEVAKTNFQNQVNAAAAPIREAASTIEAPVVAPALPTPATNPLPGEVNPAQP